MYLFGDDSFRTEYDVGADVDFCADIDVDVCVVQVVELRKAVKNLAKFALVRIIIYFAYEYTFTCTSIEY
jgi:hypothetical protein